ncbi:MAG TPA: hypothetical protein VFP52_07830, partial [Myxococcales bacterium]|nr:hypothetical protein [Myxococcales bacterium]
MAVESARRSKTRWTRAEICSARGASATGMRTSRWLSSARRTSSAPSGRRRRQEPPSTSSRPGNARLPRNASSASKSSGGWNGSRSESEAESPDRRWRSWEGVRPNSRLSASLKRRRLAKPAAWATSIMLSEEVSMSCRARCSLRVRSTAAGDAPRWRAKRRRRCRSVTPSRSARPDASPDSS